ncbi:MAG TPA: thioredoxin domain-containing protein [Stellaceae bacterium]|nr:thioredoxin domain-containing protein [Stellaceae bacterium]
MDRNRLGEETSPYLLQHKDNPVHWQPWNAAALAEAKRLDKPVLLSIGYAACHWCHVMAEESFTNPEIAKLMNERFVNIKVDREERPDLDSIYQHALALLGEQGGWPLTMFLTPDGEPYWGGTYFPPEPRWGRPSFPQVLEAMSAAYAEDRDKVAQNAAALRQALQRLGQPQKGGAIGPELLDRIAERLLREADPIHGGIGTAPKFPQTGILELLWRAWKRSGEAAYREAVEKALVGMCQGGIYDHLGGGFARYSTDARWLVPHFEKMLYDNAELVDLLTLVWQETKNPLYRQRVEETLGWVGREMLTEGGGFASSLDADSEHEEGKFYVWTEAEIDRLLGPRAALFKRFYDVTREGNWEGRTILNRLAHKALADEESERELAECRALLLEARVERVPPGRDDKVLADWNGLMIAAMANAGLVFERPDWIEQARAAFRFVASRMIGPDGRLSHSWRAGQARHPASLDDYANLCRAALALYEATGDNDFPAQTRAWLEILDRHYWDAKEGGYFFAAAETEGLIARAKTAADAPNPSGNGTLVGVLTRLASMTGEDAYRRRAEDIVATFSGEIARNFFPLATLLNNVETLAKPLQIVLVGDREAEDFAALRRAVYGASLPNRVVLALAPGESLPTGHPAYGKGLVGGHAAAYVCDGPVCSLPLTDPAALAAELAQRR